MTEAEDSRVIFKLKPYWRKIGCVSLHTDSRSVPEEAMVDYNRLKSLLTIPEFSPGHIPTADIWVWMTCRHSVTLGLVFSTLWPGSSFPTILSE